MKDKEVLISGSISLVIGLIIGGIITFGTSLNVNPWVAYPVISLTMGEFVFMACCFGLAVK